MTSHIRISHIACLVSVVACGGSDTGGPPPPPPNNAVAAVAISPKSFAVVTAATAQFGATATNSSGATVAATMTWGATGGTVSNTGLFTAGASAGPAKVWATASAFSDTATGSVAAAGSPPADTLFAEGFESGSFAVWDDRGMPGNQAIVTNAGLAHSGTRVLEVTYPLGSDGGWLTKFFMPGYDSLYVSYWVQLSTPWQSATKFVSFTGSRTDNQWSSAGKAGICPNGTDFFQAMVVGDRTGNPGPTRFYTYYPTMPREADGVTCYGSYGTNAGETAAYTNPTTLAPGAWHRIEFWMKLNVPGQSNMEHRFCIDGVLRGSWNGVSVRSSSILMLNGVTLTNSIAGGSLQAQKMWVDDLHVSRQHIGC